MRTCIAPPPPPPLSAEQADAREAVLDFVYGKGDVLAIGGAAGTGKSHLLANVAPYIPGIILAAPTNVATVRLRAATGLPASTLHRLLYQPREVTELVKGEQQTRLEWVRVAEPYAFAGKIIAMDESSMVAARIADDLLDLGARIIAVGDPYQLPPVNAVPFFSQSIIDIELQEIHRQSRNSGIVRQAYRVLDGMRYQSDGDDFRVVKECGQYLHWADMVISLRNETRIDINQRIRRMHGIDPRHLPYKGEPLVTTANNYAKGIFNGEYYIVAADMQPNGSLLLWSPLSGKTRKIEQPYIETLSPGKPKKSQTALAFAYCVTAHRAQGNEFDRVLIIDESFGSDRRTWQYTSITRAREAVVIGRSL